MERHGPTGGSYFRLAASPPGLVLVFTFARTYERRRPKIDSVADQSISGLGDGECLYSPLYGRAPWVSGTIRASR